MWQKSPQKPNFRLGKGHGKISALVANIRSGGPEVTQQSLPIWISGPFEQVKEGINLEPSFIAFLSDKALPYGYSLCT